MTPLKDQHVLILGLGESGLAMARWCAAEGASVHVIDTRSLDAGGPPQLEALKASLPSAKVSLGPDWNVSLLEDIDLIAISPGLSPLQSPQRELLAAARERNLPVWGEIELFAQKLEALKTGQSYSPKLLAITGTNGKTTVTSLTGKLCERAGLKTRVAGNISPAALDALSDALAQNDLPDVWVLELSSFQLETTRSLAADAATVLNITQDHLDWHGDMEAYTTAKARIFAPGTLRIVNRDDARVMTMAHTKESVISFGLDAPEYAGQFGLLTEGGMRWLALREAIDQEEPRPSSRQKKLSLDLAVPEPGLLKRLMPAEALQIRGDHNIANALAALALCRAIDLPIAPLLHGLREYRGEPHRVEWLMSVDDVDYVDDSKGTNVGATVAALNGLATSHASGRIVLIAGGDGKGQDFSPLKEPVQRNARAVVLIGKDASAIRLALQGCGVTITNCESLPTAVQTASALALPGDTVLLSPACASLDMFRNYKHRADVFADAVRELALEAGQPC